MDWAGEIEKARKALARSRREIETHRLGANSFWTGSSFECSPSGLRGARDRGDEWRKPSRRLTANRHGFRDIDGTWLDSSLLSLDLGEGRTVLPAGEWQTRRPIQQHSAGKGAQADFLRTGGWHIEGRSSQGRSLGRPVRGVREPEAITDRITESVHRLGTRDAGRVICDLTSGAGAVNARALADYFGRHRSWVYRARQNPRKEGSSEPWEVS